MLKIASYQIHWFSVGVFFPKSSLTVQNMPLNISNQLANVDVSIHPSLKKLYFVIIEAQMYVYGW